MASASGSGSGDVASLKAASLKAQVDRLEKALKELTVKQEQAENPDDTTSSSPPSSANDTHLRWERFEWWKLPRELRLIGPENKILDVQMRARFIRGPENKTTDIQMWARFILGAEDNAKEWTAWQRTLFRSRIGKAPGKGDSHVAGDRDGKRCWKCGKLGHIRRDCRSGNSKAGEVHEIDGSAGTFKPMQVIF